MENKYRNGKIYRIDIGEDFYIGSTCKKYLCQRKGGHVESLRDGDPMRLYVKMRELGLDFTMVELTLVKDFPCDTKQELFREEGRIQRELNPTLNDRIAGRTEAEYYQDNKEEFKEKARQYHQDHREQQNEKCRERYHKNKEERNKKGKEYYTENRDKILDYHKKYQEKNKEKLKEKAKEKSNCKYCNKELTRQHMSRHHKVCPEKPSSSNS